ncbi:MAG: hypothetical protein AAF224_14545 [Pseudomonadota bacterium]
MKRLLKAWVFATFGVVIAACASGETPEMSDLPAPSDEGGHSAIGDQQAAACPVLESGEWRAWVNRAPTVGEAKKRLIVTGVVTLPTPGYEAEWRLGVTDRALPPGQMIYVKFNPPEGIVAQVLTPTPIRFETPTSFDVYRQIRIVCGDETLANITDIITVQ